MTFDNVLISVLKKTAASVTIHLQYRGAMHAGANEQFNNNVDLLKLFVGHYPYCFFVLGHGIKRAVLSLRRAVAYFECLCKKQEYLSYRTKNRYAMKKSNCRIGRLALLLFVLPRPSLQIIF